MDHYCRTECETSMKYAPCTISITRAGRGIMVAGWPLVHTIYNQQSSASKNRRFAVRSIRLLTHLHPQLVGPK